MLDEFDEEGDNCVGDEDVEGGTDPVNAAVSSFSGVPENDQEVENIVEDGVGEDRGHDGSIFPTNKGLPGELQHAAFIKGPFRDKGGYFRGPFFEFVAVFAAQESLFRHHDAFIVDPIDERDDDEGEDIHRIDEQPGPNEIVGEVERMAHHGVDPLCVEMVGNLFGGVAARGAFGRSADRVSA